MGLGGLDDKLGVLRPGEWLTVLAERGIDDLGLGRGVSGEDVGAGELVDHHRIGLTEQLDGSHREQAGIAGAGPDKRDTGGNAVTRRPGPAGRTIS